MITIYVFVMTSRIVSTVHAEPLTLLQCQAKCMCTFTADYYIHAYIQYILRTLTAREFDHSAGSTVPIGEVSNVFILAINKAAKTLMLREEQSLK